MIALAYNEKEEIYWIKKQEDASFGKRGSRA